MKYFKFIFILLIIAVVSCNEENRIDFKPQGGNAPALVSITKVIAKPGGAVIKFDAPADVNFLCAKAVYDIRSGLTRETKASVYTDSLVVEGFADTEEHTIKIYSIGKNEVVSDQPAIVKLTPLVPPLLYAFQTCKIENSFGAIKVRYDNPSSSALIIDVYMDTTAVGGSSPEDLKLLETYYTNEAAGKLIVRGLESKERKFSVKIRDPFGNQTAMITATLTPFLEIMIPKSGFRDMLLADRPEYYNSTVFLARLWDNDWTANINDFWATQGVLPLPKTIGIDVGKSCLLSRVRWFHRYNYEWKHGTPTKWELYGSNENVVDWDKWTLIQKMGPEYKPSGLPVGQRSQEDIDFTRANGSNFDIDKPIGPFRYYKIKFMEMTDGGSFILLKEIEFFGSVN